MLSGVWLCKVGNVMNLLSIARGSSLAHNMSHQATCGLRCKTMGALQASHHVYSSCMIVIYIP